MKRDYIKERLSIDGRTIPYRIFNANVYLEEKGYSEEKREKMFEESYNLCQTLNQIIALKQACFLLRHTAYSCGSLAEDLYELKNRLITELQDEYNFEFDEDLMDNDGIDYLY